MNVQIIAKKALFKLKSASPAIALGGGIICGGIATYFACKATLKVDAVLDEAKNKVDTIHNVADNPEYADKYTENDKQRDLSITYIQTVWKLGKLYAPAIAFGTASVALLIGSYRILNKRVAALGATVAVLGESLKRYRTQVAELYGEEKERDIYFGLENQKVDEVVVDEQTGKETKKKVTVKAADVEKLISPYAVFFDISNPNYVKDDVNQNVDFLSDTELCLNRKLKAQGWLFLNEARMACGFKPIPEGQVLGWTYDDKDPNQNEHSIDLGISHISRQDVRDFRNGYEKVFIIDFDNVQTIIENFHLFDKSHRVA